MQLTKYCPQPQKHLEILLVWFHQTQVPLLGSQIPIILPVYLAMAVIKQLTTPSLSHAVFRRIILIKNQVHQVKPVQ